MKREQTRDHQPEAEHHRVAAAEANADEPGR